MRVHNTAAPWVTQSRAVPRSSCHLPIMGTRPSKRPGNGTHSRSIAAALPSLPRSPSVLPRIQPAPVLSQSHAYPAHCWLVPLPACHSKHALKHVGSKPSFKLFPCGDTNLKCKQLRLPLRRGSRMVVQFKSRFFLGASIVHALLSSISKFTLFSSPVPARGQAAEHVAPVREVLRPNELPRCAPWRCRRTGNCAWAAGRHGSLCA